MHRAHSEMIFNCKIIDASISQKKKTLSPTPATIQRSPLQVELSRNRAALYLLQPTTQHTSSAYAYIVSTTLRLQYTPGHAQTPSLSLIKSSRGTLSL